MAKFEGSLHDFHVLVGPKIRNDVATITKKTKNELNSIDIVFCFAARHNPKISLWPLILDLGLIPKKVIIPSSLSKKFFSFFQPLFLSL